MEQQEQKIEQLRLLITQSQMMISAILPEKDPADYVDLPPGILLLEPTIRPKTAEERGL